MFTDKCYTEINASNWTSLPIPDFFPMARHTLRISDWMGVLSSLPLKAVSTLSTPFFFPSSPPSLVDFQNVTAQLCAGCKSFALQVGPRLC